MIEICFKKQNNMLTFEMSFICQLRFDYLFCLYFSSSDGRVSLAQEQKIVEIKGLEFYSSMFHSSTELVTMNSMANSYSASIIGSEGKHYSSILAPCDVTLVLSVWTSQLESLFSISIVHLVIILDIIITHSMSSSNWIIFLSCLWCSAHYRLFFLSEMQTEWFNIICSRCSDFLYFLVQMSFPRSLYSS